VLAADVCRGGTGYAANHVDAGSLTTPDDKPSVFAFFGTGPDFDVDCRLNTVVAIPSDATLTARRSRPKTRVESDHRRCP
jgi:hypothetical protein